MANFRLSLLRHHFKRHGGPLCGPGNAPRNDVRHAPGLHGTLWRSNLSDLKAIHTEAVHAM
jgi:hypothetical protein